jgi:biopolymer transport protein ExbB
MDLVHSLKGFFLGSGAVWVLWLLLALAVASLAVGVERALFFRARAGDLPALARAIERHLAAEDLAAARALVGRSRAVAAVVADAGLRAAHLGPAAAEKAMQGAQATERERLEARLAFLGTVGNNAPFVGLFGTVIGVIQAFEQLGAGNASSGAGQAVSQAVMAGIAEALVATAVGIAVALPAVALHNYFQRRIAGLLAGTEAVTGVVLAYLLAEPPGARAPLEDTGETTAAGAEAPARRAAAHPQGA